MSKVKLRSRNYKLSQDEITTLCNNFSQKRKLRNSGNLVKDGHSKTIKASTTFEISNQIVDKGSESSLAETSSLNSQTLCQWDGCEYDCQPGVSVADELEQHLLDAHVKAQLVSGPVCNVASRRRAHFFCLWRSCKVYKRASLSYPWLARHVLEHTDNRTKPHCCLFRCGQRFSNLVLLERHVQSHLSDDSTYATVAADSAVAVIAPPPAGPPTLPTEPLTPLMQHKFFQFTVPLKIDVPRLRKTNSGSKKQLVPRTYHVHRPDYLDNNQFCFFKRSWLFSHLASLVAQLQYSSSSSPSSSQRTKSDSSNLMTRLSHLRMPPDQISAALRHPSILRLFSLNFHIVGSRSFSNGVKQLLVQFVAPQCPRQQTSSDMAYGSDQSEHNHWIDDTVLQVARALAQRKESDDE